MIDVVTVFLKGYALIAVQAKMVEAERAIRFILRSWGTYKK